MSGKAINRYCCGRRALALCVAVAVSAGVTGCADDSYSNEPKPPAYKTLSVVVGESDIAVSPKNLGAGPTRFVMTNQTGIAQDVTVSTDRTDRTIEIASSQTANFKLVLAPGPLQIDASNSTAEVVELRIGPERESAQQDLNQP